MNELDLYDYALPERLIAHEPANPRDSSRLLVLRRELGTWEHRRFSELPSLLSPDTLIVANNSRVLRARLLGRRKLPDNQSQAGLGQGKVEFLLLEKRGELVWEGLMKASARAIPGFCFEVPIESKNRQSSIASITGTVLHGASESPSGTVVVQFDHDPVTTGAGELPLPHYIDRKTQPDQKAFDENNYQTVFSKHLGSAAAPTAGLHFSDQIKKEVLERGIQWEEVTLHVGVGTFRPVKSDTIAEHVMHEEKYEVSKKTSELVSNWKHQGKKVLAIGTTSVRTLESAWNVDSEHPQGHLQTGWNRTSIFIRPGINYRFKVVDQLLTNFHLPKSTLLMLVCTLAGRELTLAAYQEAIRENYRFYSYGDAMLIL